MLKKLFFALVIILAAICVSGAIYRPAPEPQKVQVTYTVHTGQTLWQITSELQGVYGDKRDIREVMYHIREDNGIKGHIYPGQRLNITLEATK